VGQSCLPAHEDGHPHGSQGQGCPPAQGEGLLSNNSSDTSANSGNQFDKAIYQFGSVTIVLNTILCFVATKKSWARSVIYDQIKKYYRPAEIEQAHNIVISLSDSRKPRNTTRDTKRMINVIVHTMIDQCVDNQNVVFATTTTDTPPTDWSPPKKSGISTPFVKFFQKSTDQETQTCNGPSFTDQNLIENKIDLLIGMFSEQQLSINKIIEQKQAEDISVTQEPPYLPYPTRDQTTYETFPFTSPPPVTTPPTSTPNPSSTPSTPIPTTGNPSPPKPSSPLSLPAASQLPHALADSPTFNSAEPSTCPSTGAPSQQTPAHTDSPASPKSTKTPPAVRPKTNTPKKTKVEASTQVTPKRSFRKKQNNKNNKQIEPLDPTRHWEETAQQQVEGATALPTAPPPPAVSPVIINNYAERTKSTQDVDEDGYTKVISRNQRKKDRENQTPKPLKGADRPNTVYLYITSCHPDTNEEDIEQHLSEKFENISSVKAHKTVMTHDYYASFTVSVRGKDIKPDLFIDSDAFPDNVKVFLNRNKYKRDQNV